MLLNGGTLTGGSIVLAGTAGGSGSEGLAIYTSLAGGSITSNFTTSGFSARPNLATFGPGLLTLGGNVAGGLTINSGSVRIAGTISGAISLFGDATLSGTGRSTSAVGGGHVSPGNSAGILTASSAQSSVTSTHSLGASFNGLPSFTAYAFEFTSLGAPTFNLPGASGNDLLRLTHPTTPFVSALTSDNEIALYFNLAAGVHLGDSFLGGFFTDSNAPFDGSILGATWRVFLADPFGDTTFNGIKYSASPNGVLVSTVPQTADFGAGNVNGYVAKVTIVPEPGAGALLTGAAGLLSLARLRLRQPAAIVRS